jgi:hypothetical protein
MLLDAARAHVARIQSAFTAGEYFHPGMSAEQLRAILVDCVLRAVLPARYRVAQGLLFSTDTALETPGVLVVDALHALPLGEHFAVETVFAWCQAVFELDVDNLELHLVDIARFKKLKRDTATAHDVTPLHQLRVFGARYAQLSDDRLNPPLGYLFAGEAAAPERLLTRLNELIRADSVRAEHTPDAIICAHGGWLIARQTRTGELAVPRSTFAKFGIYRVGDDLMLLVYMLMNAALAQIQLRGPDLMRALSTFNRHAP